MTTDIDLPADRSAIRPLVGRDRELTEILACLDQAQAGRGSLAMVVGAPGIGKSRLVDEVASVATHRGFRVLWGRCWDTAGAPPYWPWVQVLRAYLRTTNPEDLRGQLGSGAQDVAQMLPELSEMFPDLPPTSVTDPESARFQLFDSTTTFLLNASRASGGLVVVIDDLHAADLASILLLLFVSKQVREGPLLVVATYRDVELTPDHPLSGALPDLARDPSTVFFELLGLTEASTRSLVEELAGFDPRPTTVKALHRSTAGNPLFIRETIRLLVSEGRLSAESDSGALSETVVPARVHEVITRRLTHVSEPSRNLLARAAVIGPEFSTDAIRTVADLAEDELLDRLDETVQAGLLTTVPGVPGRFRFSHDLIRETLYAGLTPAKRVRLHRLTAEGLEKLYAANRESHLDELAHHYFEAVSSGQGARAVEYASLAGEQAARSLAYEEAARLFAMAVMAHEADGTPDPAAQCQFLLSLGVAQNAIGDLQAKRSFLRAAEIARRIGAAEQLARAALGYGGNFIWARAGGDERMVPLLQDALVLLGGDDDRLRVRLLTRLACAQRSSPDREHHAALSQQAVELARSIGDPRSLAYALSGRFAAIWWPENAEERLEIVRELREVATEAGDGVRMLESHAAAYFALSDLGRPREGVAEVDAIENQVRQLRQLALGWMAATIRAHHGLLEGRLEEAESQILKQMEWTTSAHDEISSSHFQLFLLRREQGRLAEFESSVRTAVAAFPWFPLHRAALALLLAESGRRDEGQMVLSQVAAERFGALHRDNEWLLGMALSSEAAALLGDQGSADLLYEELSPFAGKHAVGQPEGSMGAVDRYLGLLAEILGRESDARRHLEDAEKLNERMGARPWTLRSQADLARVLRHRNQAADQARAVALERSARDGATELGMVALLAQLDREAGQEPPAREASAASAEHTFRREGDYWLVEFDGSAVRVRDAKGMGYLARLLADPGRELHVLDLAGTPGATAGAAATSVAGGDDLATDGLGDAGARLDPQAKAEYRRRVDELRSEIVEAEEWNDPERAARARDELAFVTQELAGAVGLGGRDRKAASASERARLSVTRAVRSAMDRLRVLDAPLGAHLDATIRTGTYCAYVPDPRAPVRWVV